MTPDPPNPFLPAEHQVIMGQALYRVHNRKFRGAEFNPGYGARTRFAPFGDPVVPILYAAEKPIAAIAEGLLHDIPAVGGELLPDAYEPRNLTPIIVGREGLKIASFIGADLRRIQVEAADLTGTRPTQYRRTVRWAEAAHAAGFAGVAYMSRMSNDSVAYAFFGDRVEEPDFTVSLNTRSFNLPDDIDWLSKLVEPFHITLNRRRTS